MMNDFMMMGELGYEIWQARLREAEHDRLLRSLPRRKVRPVWEHIGAFFAGKASGKRVVLEATKA
jgi:hypothetical protein